MREPAMRRTDDPIKGWPTERESDFRMPNGRAGFFYRGQILLMKWCGECGTTHSYDLEAVFCDECGADQRSFWSLTSEDRDFLARFQQPVAGEIRRPYTDETRRLK